MGARQILSMFEEGKGRFNCTRMDLGATVLIIPSLPPGEMITGIVGWGNGTGANGNTYTPLLTAFCEEGVVVAAATTANPRSGEEVMASVALAKRMLANRLASNLRVLTAGHSQGGCAANNAAALLDADAIINFESDTRFTCQIQERNPPTREALALYGSADTLAPRGDPNGNGAAIRRNTPGPLVEVEIRDAAHVQDGPVGRVTPTSRPQRALAVAFVSAELRNDDRARLAQSLFFGMSPNTIEGLMGGQGGVATFTMRNAPAMALVK